MSTYASDHNKKPQRVLSFLLPTFGDIIWLCTFLMVLIRGRNMINADGDLALHLNLGRYIRQYREIPLLDVFSHTMTGEPVIQHEWLTTLIFSLTEKYFGLTGIIFICALVVATAFWLLYSHIRKNAQPLILTFLVVFLTMIISMTHWLARPHLITFLLLTLWMIVITRLRSGSLKYWWLLPLMMLAWVNLHGGYIVGFITWFIYGFGLVWDTFWGRISRSKDLPHNFWAYYLLSGISAFVMSLINPSGFKLWEKVIFHVGNRYLADFTVEFRSPNFHWTSLWPALLFIMLFIIALGYRSKRVESGLLFNAVAWLMMGLYSGRNIPLFAIIAAPILVSSLNEVVIELTPRLKILEKIRNLDLRVQTIEKQLTGFTWPLIGICITILGLVLGYSFDHGQQGYAFDPEVFPIEAVTWLKAHPQEGKMFNTYEWGGYLQYQLWPQKQVFIDSKADFYGEEFVRKYEQVIELREGWENILDQYNVDWAILPTNEALTKALTDNLGWQLIYEDKTTVILAH